MYEVANVCGDTAVRPIKLTLCVVLTVLIKVFVGVPADQRILGIVVHGDTWAILQAIHTLTRSTERHRRKSKHLLD